MPPIPPCFSPPAASPPSTSGDPASGWSLRAEPFYASGAQQASSLSRWQSASGDSASAALFERRTQRALAPLQIPTADFSRLSLQSQEDARERGGRVNRVAVERLLRRERPYDGRPNAGRPAVRNRTLESMEVGEADRSDSSASDSRWWQIQAAQVAEQLGGPEWGAMVRAGRALPFLEALASETSPLEAVARDLFLLKWLTRTLTAQLQTLDTESEDGELVDCARRIEASLGHLAQRPFGGLVQATLRRSLGALLESAAPHQWQGQSAGSEEVTSSLGSEMVGFHR